MTIPRVGILSPGDMGHVVARVLKDHGLTVVTCLKDRSNRTKALTQKVGIRMVPDYKQLVTEADMILSILVPAQATNAANTVFNALRSTDRKIIYVDCNAISPSTVKSIENTITKAGSTFIDAGIIGPPPLKQGTTIFYASGSAAHQFKILDKYGLNIRLIGTQTGQASGFKMTYAALTKGTMAIAIELLIAAKRMNIYHPLINELKHSQPERYLSIKKGLPFMPPKANRWIGEMEEIANTFENIGLTPKIFLGAADIYRFVGESELAKETPENMDNNRTFDTVINLLSQHKK